MKSLSLGVLVLMALAHPAAAQGRERVAVVSFKMIGGALADPNQQQQVRASLVGGLAASSFEVVPQAEVEAALQGAAELARCDTAACLRRVGELVKARWVVRGQLESVGANWLIQIELIDVRDSTTAAHADETCDVCTVAEAKEKLSNAAAALRDKLQASKPIAPPPIAPPPVEPSHHVDAIRMWRILGIAAVSAGAIGVIAGIVLMALDHSEFGRHFDAQTHLVIQRYDTLAPGIALTVVGAAAIGGGAWALWHDRTMQRQISVAPAASPTGASLVVLGRF
ncbi:MAG TPA: hypothetical protein VFF06_04515 [Polyangia bacterium]|nr:hypothetical protein [Polyangia bacterium]